MNYAKKKFDVVLPYSENIIRTLLGKWEAYLRQQPEIQIENTSIREINHSGGVILATLEAKISANGKRAVLITKVFSDPIH